MLTSLVEQRLRLGRVVGGADLDDPALLARLRGVVIGIVTGAVGDGCPALFWRRRGRRRPWAWRAAPGRPGRDPSSTRAGSPLKPASSPGERAPGPARQRPAAWPIARGGRGAPSEPGDKPTFRTAETLSRRLVVVLGVVAFAIERLARPRHATARRPGSAAVGRRRLGDDGLGGLILLVRGVGDPGRGADRRALGEMVVDQVLHHPIARRRCPAAHDDGDQRPSIPMD